MSKFIKKKMKWNELKNINIIMDFTIIIIAIFIVFFLSLIIVNLLFRIRNRGIIVRRLIISTRSIR